MGQGDAIRLVGVRFQPAGKAYHFLVPADLAVENSDWVVVETVYGEQVGRVVETEVDLPNGLEVNKLKDVLRVASGLDMARYYVMQERCERILAVAQEEIAQHQIELKTFAAEFTLDGSNAIVTGIGRAGKKQIATLRRRLASRMSCRVDLRSVGPRDHAKTLCGYGVCGEERCCSRFLCEFQTVSIRMAKDQAISMAPTDITGMCGRLRCCLAYEHAVYQEASQSLPRLKARVQTEKGIGRVIDLDILKGDLVVEIPPDGPRVERERFRFAASEVKVIPGGGGGGGGAGNGGGGNVTDNGDEEK
ncbi:MAG: stage 0 sporulation protein [Anaerolineae bacterium]|nr:stage 0 sporulation protein [Anaerolineae bacterium]